MNKKDRRLCCEQRKGDISQNISYLNVFKIATLYLKHLGIYKVSLLPNFSYYLLIYLKSFACRYNVEMSHDKEKPLHGKACPNV